MKRILIFLTAATLALSLDAVGQAPSLKKQKFHWGQGDSDTTAGYAQAVLVDNVLYISGTVGGGDMEQAVKQVYSGLKRTLEHYGLTFRHVVKENLYTTDIEAVKQHNSIRKSYYDGDFPAATWVQISRLYMARATLEVELVAHLPPK